MTGDAGHCFGLEALYLPMTVLDLNGVEDLQRSERRAKLFLPLPGLL